MKTAELSSKLALTDYQKDAVKAFLDAAKSLHNAGVYVVEDHNQGNIYFCNRLNIKRDWIGETKEDCPFDNPEKIEFYELNSVGGIKVEYDDIFDNYSLPDDALFVDFK